MNVESEEEMTFGRNDLSSELGSINDPMVITMDITNFSVHKILVDNGNFADIIFWEVIRRMGLEDARMEPMRIPLVGLGGSEITPLGTIDLPVLIGEEPRRRMAVESTYHIKMKFPTKSGIGEGINPEVIVQTVNIDPMAQTTEAEEKIVRTQRNRIIEEELSKLVKAGYMAEREILGIHVNERGIKANLEKIEAIMQLKSPKMLKDVQKLTVFTNHPLRHIMARPDASGRLVKWAVEMGEHDIEYKNRTTIKAQFLADFFVEFTYEQVLENKELPGILWVYRTIPQSTTGETPFCLVYGTDAIIPTEIGEEAERVTQYDANKNHEERVFDLTMIEEKRDDTYAKILHHKG
ncbi:UNVERIFIED_CONTAM: hypothetical protein Scaly_1786300 [Sesamum calycinum]|uniref:Reverse transcriptase domain-containing protein n=1 Tax=Sesamum calycinum TaxID=2727403 RepID=A0AAW2NWQ6_9LAMI